MALAAPWGSGGFAEAEVVEAFAEGESGDAEPFCGLGLVAAGLFHGDLEQDPLGFVHQTLMGVVGSGLTGLGEEMAGEDFECRGGVGGGGAFGLGEGGADVIDADMAAAEEEELADDVGELPDVAGPGLGLEELDGLGCEGGLTDAEFAGESEAEMVGEGGDVLGALAEGWEGDGELAESIEEVFAEETFGEHLFEVAMGGGEDADIDGEDLVAADAGDDAFLEDAKELGLGGKGEVADLVEENGAALGLFESADAACDGAGEGAAFVSEEFGFEEGFGDGGAIDGDEGGLGAVAVLVEGAGDEFLAGTGLATDEDIDGLCGDAADFLVDVAHGAALADEGVLGGAAFAEADGFGHEASGGDGACGDAEEFLHVEGFEEVLEGAVFGGFDGGFGGAVGGDEDDGEPGLGEVKLADDVEAGGAGETPVGDDDVMAAGEGGGEAGGAIGLDLHLITFGGEEATEGGGGAGIVLDEEEAWGGLHGRGSADGGGGGEDAGGGSGLGGRGDEGEMDGEGGAAIGMGLVGEGAAVSLDDADADAEAETGATGLGGEEGVEEAALDLLGDAGAGIGDGDVHDGEGAATGTELAGLGAEGDGGARRGGFEGIADEIDEHLLELFGVGGERGVVEVTDHEADVASGGLGFEESGEIAEEGPGLDELRAGIAGPGEAEEIVDDPFESGDLGSDDGGVDVFVGAGFETA